MTPLLEVNGLRVTYGGAVAVHDVSFQIGAGQMLALLGANGAGKTTTLRAISGLVPVKAGAIRWEGRDITSMRPPDIALLGIAHVPEGRGLFPTLTVTDNLRMGLYGAGRNGTAEGTAAIDHVLDLFPILAERHDQQAGTMSGGQQQMLAVARALVQAPSLLVLDEMSMGLAPAVVDELLAVIGQLRDEGMAVLLVEQFVEHALAIADTAVVLEQGRVVASGTTSDLARDDLAAAYLGRDVGTLDIPPAPDFAREHITVTIVSREARALARRAAQAGVDPEQLASEVLEQALQEGSTP